MTIKWKTVTGASGYYIYRSTDGGKAKKIATVKGSKASSYTDAKVSLGKKYKYSVRAYWQSGSKTQTGAVGTATKTASAKLATPKLFHTEDRENQYHGEMEKSCRSTGLLCVPQDRESIL
ncbi:MAG: hypothetical protein V8R80_07810 [Eubacterium sp.]